MLCLGKCTLHKAKKKARKNRVHTVRPEAREPAIDSRTLTRPQEMLAFREQPTARKYGKLMVSNNCIGNIK